MDRCYLLFTELADQQLLIYAEVEVTSKQVAVKALHSRNVVYPFFLSLKILPNQLVFAI